MKIKKIAVMGAGAIGSYYGGLLAKKGYDVTFIGRGSHLQAMKVKGLQIKSKFGNFSLPKVNATDNIKDVGKVDFIFFTVKTYDAVSAAKLMLPIIKKETIILPIQNANMAFKVGEVVGMEYMLGGVTYVYSAVESPGIINQTSDFHKVIFGEFSNKKTERTKAIFDLFNSVGVTAIETDDIQKAVWSKLIFIGPSCGVSSVVKLTSGEYRDIPETRKMLIDAMKEVESIALVKKINLDKDIVDQQMKFTDNLHAGATTSMQRDIANGKKSELEELIGMTIQMGKKSEVPTPVHEFIYASLKPREIKVRKELSK